MRDGFTWTQSFARGKATSKLTKGKATRKTGTIITFWPDPEVFEEGVEFDVKLLAERLQEHAFLTKGVEIQLIDERGAKHEKQVFKAWRDRRLRQAPVRRRRTIHNRVISMEARDRGRHLAAVDRAYLESIHLFANTINTHEGGCTRRA